MNTDAAKLVCNFGALNEEQRARYRALREWLKGSVQEQRELPDGFGFRHPADAKSILCLAEFVTLEKLCCPFLRFTIEVESDTAWLQLRGTPEVKEFLQAEL